MKGRVSSATAISRIISNVAGASVPQSTPVSSQFGNRLIRLRGGGPSKAPTPAGSYPVTRSNKPFVRAGVTAVMDQASYLADVVEKAVATGAADAKFAYYNGVATGKKVYGNAVAAGNHLKDLYADPNIKAIVDSGIKAAGNALLPFQDAAINIA